ncbi:DUF2190 family protein [Aurantimonas coralicida]|uniref:DUF2190 family protein n=1 Tax=Aurantimonas coralicida TaxID=182270 RepID=UPI001E401487|nr:capsid cement protein [Aurantimonas coralicida]MCD1642466.1 DUF2190 family protein [Aurantimonas coralicida]
MKNYIQQGNVATVVATTDITSGDVVVAGKLVGVAGISAPTGSETEVALTGVYTVPKATGTAWTQGALVYWTGTEASTVASGNTAMGHAFVPAESAAAVGNVRLAN